MEELTHSGIYSVLSASLVGSKSLVCGYIAGEKFFLSSQIL